MAIPMKPLAVSKAKKKLPVEIDWGPGIPKDRLRYINAQEEALIKRHRTTKAARDYAGIKAYADDSASSKGVSRGPSNSSSSSGSKTASSGNKTSSGLSAASSGQSRAPNAAAQAASNAYRGASSGSRFPSAPGQTAPNGSYYGPKGGNALNTNARYAAARSVGFNPSPVQRTPGDAEAMGRMMMAESASIRNQYGNVSVPGLSGVGEVIRNRMLSERFPNTVGSVISQKSQFSPWKDGSYAQTPANPMATRIAESILSGESPPTVGTSLNYGNLDTINNKPGYSSSRTKAAFNSMPVEAQIADYRNPRTFSHSFGTIGEPSDVSFNGIAKPSNLGSVGLAAAVPPKGAAGMQSAPAPQAIPTPDSYGILGSQMRDPAAAPAQFAAAIPSAPSGFNPPGLRNDFRGTPGQAYTGSLPGIGYSPLADGRPPRDNSGNPASGWGSSPSAPQIAAAPSESPSQGPGPAVEDPGTVEKRQKSYAARGATIGSVIAGPLGAIVGGTLGWQMAKTSPGQRQAIASNPQALQANVQSINQMVEERGGRSNPQMQVTEPGLQDVLTNPAKVTQNPQQYTTLEQMLAALAQGIDPATGKSV